MSFENDFGSHSFNKVKGPSYFKSKFEDVLDTYN